RLELPRGRVSVVEPGDVDAIEAQRVEGEVAAPGHARRGRAGAVDGDADGLEGAALEGEGRGRPGGLVGDGRRNVGRARGTRSGQQHERHEQEEQVGLGAHRHFPQTRKRKVLLRVRPSINFSETVTLGRPRSPRRVSTRRPFTATSFTTRPSTRTRTRRRFSPGASRTTIRRPRLRLMHFRRSGSVATRLNGIAPVAVLVGGLFVTGGSPPAGGCGPGGWAG